MTCTAIITEDGIDQIIEHGDGTEPLMQRHTVIIKREVRDLRAMGCTVKTKVFDCETDAYEWADKQTRF
jgi:hypothetical protein